MDEGSYLKSVNWTTGMLLSPQHFRRQDAFLEETVGWLLQYCLPGTGLVGAGIRVTPGERGLARFDPRVDVHEEGKVVYISILEARGLTALGQLVDISEGNTVRGEFPTAELAGKTELQVYVVHGGAREEDSTSIGVDENNPTQAAYRRVRYSAQLGTDADTLPHALCVGRVRRLAESLQFELDPRFIPACATMLGHSQLVANWRRLHGGVVTLSTQYAELHRKCARWVADVAQRGADVSHDRDILAFVERAVLALDHCAYETFEPAIPPDTFFREIERAGRRVALALDLSESTRLYFTELGVADASYGSLLEEERDALVRPRDVGSSADLQLSVARADSTLERLRRLADALEARYIDYRVSRAIESLRFLIDGEGFFLLVTTPGYPQRDLDTLTFVFSQLSLLAHQRYRLVFLAEQQGQTWQPGETFRADVRLNPGSFNGRPQSYEIACALPGQRNFAIDFDLDPSIALLSALQVTVQPGVRIRGCLLYQRRLGMKDRASMMVSPPPVPEVASAPGPLSPPVTVPTGSTTGPKPPPRVNIIRRDKNN